ncbi:dihydroneopterin aldolase [Candidatus Bipolaricaulota bacterium]|nr:dihydroneopterin aldolase [Candidatus Bipolaricaulota bacterium]
MDEVQRTIRLGVHGLEFRGNHGVFEQERQTGTRFRVDIEIEADVAVAVSSDELDDSIDYQEIAKIIDTVNRSRSYHLIESLAAAMVDALLRGLPRARRVFLRLSKLSPPGFPAGAATFVEFTRSRE